MLAINTADKDASNQGFVDALLVRLYRYHIFTPSKFSDEQMGLLYVGTYALKKGYKIRVLDEPHITLDRLLKVMRSLNPKIVGFYCDHENMAMVISTIKEIKKLFPQVITVVGGPQASNYDAHTLSESDCDIAVRGEGEITFYELLEWYNKKSPQLKDIKGITYYHSGKITRNEPRKVTVDLDIFPIPDRSLNVDRQMPGVENLVTGRGCVYQCAFCHEGVSDSFYRARSVDNVVEEIKMLLQTRKPYYITILDDVFMLNHNRVIEFCEKISALREQFYDFAWYCEARADIIVKHPEMIQAAVKAGMARIQIGIESGNQFILDSYRKNLTLEDIRDAVRICSEYGVLSIVGNFIIGGAHESKQTIEESIKFAENLLEIGKGRIDIITTLYTPYPGTSMYNSPEQFGLEILDKECVTGPGDNYVFVKTKDLSKWEIFHYRQVFEEAINSKMMKLLPEIPNDLILEHFKAFMKNGIKTKWFDFFTRYFNIYNYFGLKLTEDYKHLAEVDPSKIWEYKPVRTVFLGTTIDENFIIDLKYKILKLDKISSRIIELSYGRLTLSQIAREISKEFYADQPIEEVKKYVKEFVSELNKERLIVFSYL